VDERLHNRIGEDLTAIFLGRQLQLHRTYNVQGPHLCQHTRDRIAGMLHECLEQQIDCRPLFPADLAPQLDLLIDCVGKQPS
jgi:hypothetical protein